MQTSTQSPNFSLPFTSGPTSERCWVFCSLFPWLVYANQASLPVPSVFLFECCLEGKPCACPWERVSAFLPDTPDSGGMAACAKDAPSKPDTKFLKWFVVQDLPSLWRQLLIGDALTEAMLISLVFVCNAFPPSFWHWHVWCLSFPPLIYTWVFCSYENLWLRHNWAVSLLQISRKFMASSKIQVGFITLDNSRKT